MSALVGGLAAAVTSSLKQIDIRGYSISWRIHRRQYLTDLSPSSRSPHPRSARTVVPMSNDERPAEKRSAWTDSSSWIVGMLVGLAIGISLGVAMDNMGAGIAIGAGIGVAFAVAFSQSKKGQR